MVAVLLATVASDKMQHNGRFVVLAKYKCNWTGRTIMKYVVGRQYIISILINTCMYVKAHLK